MHVKLERPLTNRSTSDVSGTRRTRNQSSGFDGFSQAGSLNLKCRLIFSLIDQDKDGYVQLSDLGTLNPILFALWEIVYFFQKVSSRQNFTT